MGGSQIKRAKKRDPAEGLAWAEALVAGEYMVSVRLEGE